MKRARVWIVVKRNDLILAFYGLWLATLTILILGWPWHW